jgi:hypothetical protein
LKYYIFGKSSDSDGTSVESVGSSASYAEMDDIEYFLRSFIKMFKVPFSRYKTPENTIEKNESITYEEYSFSRMIIRFQRRFANGFKKGFITHLKLRDLWDKKDYELQESDIQVSFASPVLYDLYEKQKLTEANMAIYKSYSENDEMSKSLAMKKCLGWTDAEIEENFTSLIKDKQRIAIADYFGELVTADNPPIDYKSPIRLKNDIEEVEKTFSPDAPKNEDSGEGDDGSTEGDESTDGSEEEEESETKEAEDPTFGLG